MAYSNTTFVGYVKKLSSIEAKSAGLKVNIAVPTGDRKKEGEQYNPSNFFQVTLWGKQAEALSGILEVGQTVLVDGRLGQPYLYSDEDGEPKCIQQVTWINDFRLLSTAEAKEEEEEDEPVAKKTSKAKATSAAKKRPAPVEEFEDDEFDDMEFE